jgi:histone-lysine N-methyltransferase SUV39H
VRKNWQVRVNAITKERPFIVVENDVDFTGPPEGFEFVNDYVPSAGILIPCDPPVGCTCNDACYENRGTCCAKQFGAQFAYTKFRKVGVPVGTPIYECNRKCRCGPDCPNRIVQDGKTDMKLSIFRTANGCGWGVKTLKVCYYYY